MGGSGEQPGGVAALILAAGGSSRLGRPKQLLRFRGRTLIRRAVSASREAGLAPVLVVLGAARDAIGRDLVGTGALVVEHPAWRDGPASSIRAGLRRLEREAPGCEAVLLQSCDQPYVDADLLRRMVARMGRAGGIVACRYAGCLGVPALFRKEMFPELSGLRGRFAGARRLLRARASEVVAVEFPDGAFDVDTAADYEELLRRERLERGRHSNP